MNIDWTHKDKEITDVRKVKKFYVLSINDKKITNPLFVDHTIFEGRVNSYYLRGFENRSAGGGYGNGGNITREEVINVKWNMVINKGYYIKLDSNGNNEEVHKDPEKFYVSFLEISGPLGNHVSN